MVPPYQVIRTKAKPTLQNPAQIYIENWLIQGMTVIQNHFLEVPHPFIACTFSAVREIPAAEMVVPRYCTLCSVKKNLSGLSLRPQSCNRVSIR